LNHTPRAERMASRGRTEVIKNFSTRTMVNKNVKVYQQILKIDGT